VFGACRCLQVLAGACRCLQVLAGACRCLQVLAGVSCACAYNAFKEHGKCRMHIIDIKLLHLYIILSITS